MWSKVKPLAVQVRGGLLGLGQRRRTGVDPAPETLETRVGASRSRGRRGAGILNCTGEGGIVGIDALCAKGRVDPMVSERHDLLLIFCL